MKTLFISLNEENSKNYKKLLLTKEVDVHFIVLEEEILRKVNETDADWIMLDAAEMPFHSMNIVNIIKLFKPSMKVGLLLKSLEFFPSSKFKHVQCDLLLFNATPHESFTKLLSDILENLPNLPITNGSGTLQNENGLNHLIECQFLFKSLALKEVSQLLQNINQSATARGRIYWQLLRDELLTQCNCLALLTIR
jgi:hypothetical protein